MNLTAPQPSRWRYGPLAGYLIAMAVGAVVLYGLLFHIHSELLQSCQRVNDFRTEVNRRVPVINELVRIEQTEDARAALRPAARVPLTDCAARFHEPWPFG